MSATYASSTEIRVRQIKANGTEYKDTIYDLTNRTKRTEERENRKWKIWKSRAYRRFSNT